MCRRAPAKTQKVARKAWMSTQVKSPGMSKSVKMDVLVEEREGK
jgi:hypothetical protein